MYLNTHASKPSYVCKSTAVYSAVNYFIIFKPFLMFSHSRSDSPFLYNQDLSSHTKWNVCEQTPQYLLPHSRLHTLTEHCRACDISSFCDTVHQFIHLWQLFCTITNKCTSTINLQIITLLHVLTLSCRPQGACDQYLTKLHKYFKCSCW